MPKKAAITDEPAEEIPAGDEPPELAKLLFFPDQKGGYLVVPKADATPEQKKNAILGAKERKAIFEHRRAGALTRAGLLPRALTAALAAGTVNHVLNMILQDELRPGSAKEAIEVAKGANEVYKLAAGALDGKDMTAEGRKDAQEAAAALGKTLAERAARAEAALGGAPDGGGDLDAEPLVFTHDDDGQIPDPAE